MRQIVLDTETTGLEVKKGHRIIEIGAVELIERRPGRTWHAYLNPDRAIDAGAREVTGIADDFLRDKPHFADVIEAFIAFIAGGELIIHNAPFDVGFLDAELTRLDGRFGALADHVRVLDTLAMARERYPGQRNSLDALCRRLGVDNTRRELHGGLLDAQLLAEVYLALTAGQSALELGFASQAGRAVHAARREPELTHRPRIMRASEEENAAHERRLDALDRAAGGKSLWRQLDPKPKAMSAAMSDQSA
jgi:DNA polymerase-3 subunit epsilon